MSEITREEMLKETLKFLNQKIVEVAKMTSEELVEFRRKYKEIIENE